MNHTMLVGVLKNGSIKVLRSPSGESKQARQDFAAYKVGDLPDGVIRVELWSRDKITTGVDRKLEKQRLNGGLVPLSPEEQAFIKEREAKAEAQAEAAKPEAATTAAVE